MSFADLTTIVVTGTYLGFDGAPSRGNVTFDATVETVLDTVGHQIIVPRHFVARIVKGAISIALPATDSPSIVPFGWLYTVMENVEGARTVTYQIAVPYDALNGTIDLASAPRR